MYHVNENAITWICIDAAETTSIQHTTRHSDKSLIQNVRLHGRRRILPSIPLIDLFSPLYFFSSLAPPNPRFTARVVRSFVTTGLPCFSALRAAENLIISGKKPSRVSVCAWPRADRVPELTLFFARSLSTLTLGAAGARCHVTARRDTSHRRTVFLCVALRRGAESRPSCWEKPHLRKKKKIARHGLSTLLCESRACRGLCREIQRLYLFFFYFCRSRV